MPHLNIQIVRFRFDLQTDGISCPDNVEPVLICASAKSLAVIAHLPTSKLLKS